MDYSIDQIEELKEQLSEHLKSIGAYQPLTFSPEENEKIIHELYSFGFHFYENGKYEEAANFYKLLTQIDSENVNHWKGLAACLQMQKLHDQALLAYSAAIVLDSNDQTLYFHTANCCFALYRIKEGLEALDLAEKIAAEKPEQGAFISQLAILREAWSNVDNTDNN